MATMRQGPTVHLTITNHPSGGPVFAGPQVQPWVCRTVAGFGAPDGRAVQHRDRVLATCTGTQPRSTFKPYDPAAPPPAAAIATTTTDQGVDRAVHRPPRARRDGSRPLRRRGARQPVRPLGAVGVAAGLEPQGALPVRRRHGAVAHERRAAERCSSTSRSRAASWSRTTTSTSSGNNANDVVSAEALMMLKEHIAERTARSATRSAPAARAARSSSTRSRATYPGLLDGHPAELQLPGQLDDRQRGQRLPPAAALLRHASRRGLHARRSRRRCGHAGHAACCTPGMRRFVAGRHPVARRELQPAGDAVRGDGLRRGDEPDRRSLRRRRTTSRRSGASAPQDGFARSPYANVGIQYGLTRANAGTITPEQFVDLNEGVGGTDIDLNFTAGRIGSRTSSRSRSRTAPVR